MRVKPQKRRRGRKQKKNPANVITWKITASGWVQAAFWRKGRAWQHNSQLREFVFLFHFQGFSLNLTLREDAPGLHSNTYLYNQPSHIASNCGNVRAQLRPWCTTQRCDRWVVSVHVLVRDSLFVLKQPTRRPSYTCNRLRLKKKKKGSHESPLFLCKKKNEKRARTKHLSASEMFRGQLRARPDAAPARVSQHTTTAAMTF